MQVSRRRKSAMPWIWTSRATFRSRLCRASRRADWPTRTWPSCCRWPCSPSKWPSECAKTASPIRPPCPLPPQTRMPARSASISLRASTTSWSSPFSANRIPLRRNWPAWPRAWSCTGKPWRSGSAIAANAGRNWRPRRRRRWRRSSRGWWRRWRRKRERPFSTGKCCNTIWSCIENGTLFFRFLHVRSVFFRMGLSVSWVLSAMKYPVASVCCSLKALGFAWSVSFGWRFWFFLHLLFGSVVGLIQLIDSTSSSLQNGVNNSVEYRSELKLIRWRNAYQYLKVFLILADRLTIAAFLARHLTPKWWLALCLAVLFWKFVLASLLPQFRCLRYCEKSNKNVSV